MVSPKVSSLCYPEPIFVLAGDYFQLGPRVHDRNTNLHVSLFERLSERSVYASHVLARHHKSHENKTNALKYVPPFTDLIRNYRSHPAILAVSSSLFYWNSLIPEATRTEALYVYLDPVLSLLYSLPSSASCVSNKWKT